MMDNTQRLRPANLSAKIRRYHTYLGVLIAPSVLFFASTGVMQIYGFHESHGDYHAPYLAKALAAVHKDQVFEGRPDKPKPELTAPAEHEEETPLATSVLKAFFLVVSISLIVSTGMGVWMAFKFTRRKKLILALLICGIIVPVVPLLI